MPDFEYLPISYLDEATLSPVMDEEEKAWMADLSWDYTQIRQVLVSFIRQRLLPGYAVLNGNKAIGYTYFLVNRAKGIIGALYVSRTGDSQKAVEELLSLTISSLKEQQVQRVEAQIMPFNNLNLTATFTQHGFSYYPRYYLDLDLANYRREIVSGPVAKIIPWSASYLERAAEMSVNSYLNQTDAEICEDYRTKAGCQGYLRSLVENPGCGNFLPDASFMALNEHGSPCGFLICSRISDEAAMVPQIAVHPSYQGKGVGNVLMNHTFERLKALGLRCVSLTVTKKNSRAFDWYQRLGYKVRKEFGAYIWNR